MRRWLSLQTSSRWISAVLFLLFLAATVVVGNQLVQVFRAPPETWPVNGNLYLRVVLFLALAAASAAIAYRTLAAFTMSYDLDRNGLYINWLGNRIVVPLDQISHIDSGLGEEATGWNPLSAIGYRSGLRRLEDGRVLHRFATAPSERCLVIHTPEALYAISPSNADGFVQDLEQRRNLGAAKTISSAVEPARLFLYAFWNDPVARTLLLVALALNLLLLGLLAFRYPMLPPMIEMRFNAVGEAAEMRPRYLALYLPVAAFGLIMLNTVASLIIHQSLRIGSLLLQSASVIMQVLFGIAVLTILL